MAQNRETGAAANQFGKDTARQIAQQLKLKLLSKKSNEVIYKGERTVIKSAHLGNGYIGVTLKTLERIDLIIAAFENSDGDFDLYALDAKTFRNNIRIGHHEHIGLVRKKVFFEDGSVIRSLKLDASSI